MQWSHTAAFWFAVAHNILMWYGGSLAAQFNKRVQGTNGTVWALVVLCAMFYLLGYYAERMRAATALLE